ncbi:hypothetical protein XELAEV_18005197mg [Xenopus laevis]|uniref:Uncharacterized protein n=1 Tax=Xenopus laevis TaxID=8355 RepID=A0A974DYX2_XENLA|nr:hypothetical protein XELAEV_18005197mg [Xenopus laevis]
MNILAYSMLVLSAPTKCPYILTNSHSTPYLTKRKEKSIEIQNVHKKTKWRYIKKENHAVMIFQSKIKDFQL